MVLEEAEKLFKRLAKELDEEIITNASNMGSSLPLLPSIDERRMPDCPEQTLLHNPRDP